MYYVVDLKKGFSARRTDEALSTTVVPYVTWAETFDIAALLLKFLVYCTCVMLRDTLLLRIPHDSLERIVCVILRRSKVFTLKTYFWLMLSA